MSTKFYVPGPAQIFVGTGASNAYQCLGWSEDGVDIEGGGLMTPVKADYAGDMPADKLLSGQEIMARMTLSRFDATVLASVLAIGYGDGMGVGAANSVGRLVVAEGLAYPLLVYNPYVTKTEFSDMIPGFIFLRTLLTDKFNVRLNTKAMAPRLQFDAIPVFGTLNGSTFTANTAPYNAYQLWTDVMPSPLPTPT